MRIDPENINLIVHSWVELLGALEVAVRAGLSADPEDKEGWAFGSRKWRPLHQLVDAAVYDPRIQKEDLLELVARLVTEFDYLRNDVTNLINAYSNGDQTGRRERVNVADLAADTVLLFRFRAHERQIEISTDLEDVFLYCYPNQVRRALVNIVDNAIKYSYSGSIDRFRYVRIKTHAYSSGDALIETSSYGVGIDPDERELVKEKGYRSDHAKVDHKSGTGIGLYEVNKIAKSHGGYLTIESKMQHEKTYVTVVRLILRSLR